MIVIISNRPNCKTCGMPMAEWNPWADDHEHTECAAERVSERLIEVLKNQMSDEYRKKQETNE